MEWLPGQWREGRGLGEMEMGAGRLGRLALVLCLK